MKVRMFPKSSMFKKPKVRFKHFYKDTLLKHLSDCTAICVTATPFFVAGEMGILDMDRDVSIQAKFNGPKITYGGLGFLLSKGMEVSRTVFGMNDQSSDKSLGIHDTLYLAGFNFLACTGIYLWSGAKNAYDLFACAGMGAFIGMATGALIGYNKGVFRDCFGISEFNRKSYPSLIKDRRPITKKAILGLAAAVSLTLSVGIYKGIPESYEGLVPQEWKSYLESVSLDSEGLEKVVRDLF